MILTEDIKKYSNQSVLCWLATVSKENIPNVSPKEIFTFFESEYIIVANIASPQTEKNIKENHNVCISFIDILIQKGYQLNGKASVIDENNSEFKNLAPKLLKMTNGKFPFKNIFKIKIENAKQIIAPKYILYPETKESDQIKSAKKTYNL